MRLVPPSRQWDPYLQAIGIGCMALSWCALLLALTVLGPMARQFAPLFGPSAGGGFIATASPAARWGVLIGVGMLDAGLVISALRTSRPALWLLVFGTGVHVLISAFVFLDWLRAFPSM
jgi:hypothetical protein